jgi:restriction system protein
VTDGIDGYETLSVNPLVSFKVLFQCKRYTKSVTPSHVRDFRGAMAGRANKGIILTTGTFSAEARRESSRDGVPPIELIDGEKLVDMLEQFELGLRPVKTYEVDHTLQGVRGLTSHSRRPFASGFRPLARPLNDDFSQNPAEPLRL